MPGHVVQPRQDCLAAADEPSVPCSHEQTAFLDTLCTGKWHCLSHAGHSTQPKFDQDPLASSYEASTKGMQVVGDKPLCWVLQAQGCCWGTMHRDLRIWIGKHWVANHACHSAYTCSWGSDGQLLCHSTDRLPSKCRQACKSRWFMLTCWVGDALLVRLLQLLCIKRTKVIIKYRSQSTAGPICNPRVWHENMWRFECLFVHEDWIYMYR